MITESSLEEGVLKSITMFTSVVPGQPSKPAGSQSSRGKSNVSGGRKITAAKSKEAAPVPEAKKRKKGPTTMDDLDRILQNDHVALLSMKKDIGDAQKQEITKSIKELLRLQQEYDTLLLSNNKKDKELADVKDSITQLGQIATVAVNSTTCVEEEGASIKAELKKVNGALEAEQRTHKMLTLIAKRLTEEITACRVATTQIEFDLDLKKHENVACNSTLLISRQELGAQEKQAADLAATVKARREERVTKMKQLRRVVNEGESSVKLVQAQTAATRPVEGAEVELGPPTVASSSAPPNMAVVKKASSMRARTGSTTADEDAENAGDEDPLTAPFASFNFGAGGPGVNTSPDGGDISIVAGNEVLNFDSIRDIVERYKSKQARCEKLTAFAEELDKQLAQRQEENKSLSEQLEKSMVSNEILSSNRAMYQDVEMIDKALATARKECEDCRKKEYMLRANVGSLKRGFPRFLTKLTKVIHPVPANDQLADCIHKLIDEVSKLIKNIGTLIIKDATPDDLALLTATSQSKEASNQSAEQSEIGKIRNLPGYQRLQRQLFVNLMSARQDVTEKNVRIFSNARAAALEADNAARPDTVYSSFGGNGDHDTHQEADRSGGDVKHTETAPSAQDSLDRSTVKSISVMILDKNNARGSTVRSNNATRRQFNSH